MTSKPNRRSTSRLCKCIIIAYRSQAQIVTTIIIQHSHDATTLSVCRKALVAVQSVLSDQRHLLAMYVQPDRQADRPGQISGGNKFPFHTCCAVVGMRTT